MENSLTSDADAKMSSDDGCPEESSWTYYIQGFILDGYNKNRDDDDDDQLSDSLISSPEHQSPSLVSDANSPAAKNLSHKHDFSSARAINYHHKGITMKKPMNKVLLMDDDLEDTAISPVNSPKISYLHDQFMNHQRENVAAEMKRSYVHKEASCLHKIDQDKDQVIMNDDV